MEVTALSPTIILRTWSCSQEQELNVLNFDLEGFHLCILIFGVNCLSKTIQTPFLLTAKEETFILAAFWNMYSPSYLSDSTGKRSRKINQINFLLFLNHLIIKWALAHVQLPQCHWTRMFPQILQHSSITAVLLNNLLNSSAFSRDDYSNSEVTFLAFQLYESW